MIKLLHFTNRFYSRLVALQNNNANDGMPDIYKKNGKTNNLRGAQLP